MTAVLDLKSIVTTDPLSDVLWNWYEDNPLASRSTAALEVRPPCHITKMSLGERNDDKARKGARISREKARVGKTRTHFVPVRRRLTDREKELLGEGTLDPKSIRGCKLTKGQKAMVDKIKKRSKKKAQQVVEPITADVEPDTAVTDYRSDPIHKLPPDRFMNLLDELEDHHVSFAPAGA